jgi:hypothetical protein
MLSQAHRRSIHTSLAPVLGEEETEAFMSEFPASPSDMPATQTEFTLLRKDMQTQFAEQRSYIDDRFRSMIQWMAFAIITAMIGGMGVAAGIGAAVAG